MPKPLKEFAQQVLAEHNRGEKIRLALCHGFESANNHPGSNWWRRRTTRRAIAWENAVDKLIELLDGDPGVAVVQHHNTVSFIFDGAVLVRLKKADLALRSSNFPTPQADLFHKHNADLFGFVELQRIEAVYVPNRFNTGLIWTGVMAREKKKHPLGDRVGCAGFGGRRQFDPAKTRDGYSQFSKIKESGSKG